MYISFSFFFFLIISFIFESKHFVGCQQRIFQEESVQLRTNVKNNKKNSEDKRCCLDFQNEFALLLFGFFT